MANQYTSEYTDEIIERMITLAKVHKLPEVTKMINKEFGTDFTYSGLRTKYMREKDNWKPSVDPVEKAEYREVTEYHADGSITKNTLIEIANETNITKDFLLNAHGFKPSGWVLVNGKNSVWNQHNKQDGTVTLYSSKITVKPRTVEIDWDSLIQALEDRPTREPIPYQGQTPEKPTYLEIPLFDMHFGIASFYYYQETLQNILKLLQTSYNEVLITVGQDLIHNDNFNGTTSNGTIIDKVDMVKAINDAELFYQTIISEACKNSKHVTVTYSIGNHDKTVSYGIARSLRNMFREQSNIRFDLAVKERKAFMLGANMIGITHGDKNRKNVASNFSVEFPEMWAKATTREVHMGHLHRKRTTKQPIELTIDEKGVIVRELGTGNETDQYHEDNGFNMAHKEFEIFEYTETKKKRIHYV